ncbi:MAG TPA: class I SAM-dependent methyltransferase [Trichocoleus sp.]|jgi:tetratricopeptide (TPR) repeat protein
MVETNAETHVSIGKLLSSQGRFAEALAHFQSALAIDPNFPQLSENIAFVRFGNQILTKGYEFTQDWFSWTVPIWESRLQQFAHRPNLQAIEIGCWEGMATCWLLDNILTDPTAAITCIDTFQGSMEHQRFEPAYLQAIERRFDANLDRTGAAQKTRKIVGKSQEVLRYLPLNTYHLAYIDGSHLAWDLLEDAVLVWRLLQVGGLIIFDDYRLKFAQNPAWNPHIGIDAFISSFSPKIKVHHHAYQVMVEKLAD